MSIKWRSVFVGVALCCTGSMLWAQSQNATIIPKNNSPLSRFGLGDPLDQYVSGFGGMAGLSAAINDPYQLNLLNPAALPHLLSTSFEVGLYAKYANLKSDEKSDDVWSGNLQYMALGFPLKNPINKSLDRIQSKWDFGMSLALSPYTLVGYDIQTKQFDPDFGTVTTALKGNGGTYKLAWGNGVKYKGFSAGVNVAYLFGKLTNSRRVNFDSLAFSYNSEFLDEISVSGFTWQLGTQYVYDFKKTDKAGKLVPSGKRLIVGAYGGPVTNFNTNSSRYYYRFLSEAVRDTILYTSEVKEKGQMPASFTAGFTYEEVNKLRIGIEYSATRWSGYTNEAKPETLSDSRRIAAGMQYTPNVFSYNRYWQRVHYRAGLFHETDGRSIANDQVTKYGFTFGFGFPIIMPRQQISFIQTAFEVGKFGVPDVLQETYVKLSLGFTLNDNSWFFKRKFN